MHACVHACMWACMHVGMYAYVGMHACVGMHVCGLQTWLLTHGEISNEKSARGRCSRTAAVISLNKMTISCGCHACMHV